MENGVLCSVVFSCFVGLNKSAEWVEFVVNGVVGSTHDIAGFFIGVAAIYFCNTIFFDKLFVEKWLFGKCRPTSVVEHLCQHTYWKK